MGLFGRIVAVVAVVAVGLVIAPGRAEACSCGGSAFVDHVDSVAMVFTGSQSSLEIHSMTADNGAELAFDVERVYAGSPGPEVALRTHAQGSACGMDYGDAGVVLVVARERRGELVTSLCDSFYTIEEVEAVYGEGAPPVAVADQDADVSDEETSSEAVADDEGLVSGSGRSGGISLLIGLLAGTGVTLVVGTAVLALRRRPV